MRREDLEHPDNKIVTGVCSECGEHCEGEFDLETEDTYSECCGARVYDYEMGEG